MSMFELSDELDDEDDVWAVVPETIGEALVAAPVLAMMVLRYTLMSTPPLAPSIRP